MKYGTPGLWFYCDLNPLCLETSHGYSWKRGNDLLCWILKWSQVLIFPRDMILNVSLIIWSKYTKKYVAVFIFKFWSSSNDCILIKLCCWGILMLNTTSVLKQSTKKSADIFPIIKALKTFSFFIPIFPHLQKTRYRCMLWQDLSRDLSHRIKFKEAFGTQAVARTSFFWALSSAKTNFQREVFYYSGPLIPTASVFTRRCWPLWLLMFPWEDCWPLKLLPSLHTWFCVSV